MAGIAVKGVGTCKNVSQRCIKLWIIRKRTKPSSVEENESRLDSLIMLIMSSTSSSSESISKQLSGTGGVRNCGLSPGIK